jgi:hypothetical protein
MPPAAGASARNARALAALSKAGAPGRAAVVASATGGAGTGSSPAACEDEESFRRQDPWPEAIEYPDQGARCSLIRSTASAIASSGVVREIRKKPSPPAPYIEPGEITTAASSSTSSANEVELWPGGTGAQT